MPTALSRQPAIAYSEKLPVRGQKIIRIVETDSPVTGRSQASEEAGSGYWPKFKNIAGAVSQAGFNIGAGSGVEPPRPEGRRILSSHAGSEPFGKFSALLLFSTDYKSVNLIRSAWKWFVLNMELLQFYYSGFWSHMSALEKS